MCSEKEQSCFQLPQLISMMKFQFVFSLVYCMLFNHTTTLTSKSYYIIPSHGDHCPKVGVPCLTLSQFAAKAQYDSNVTLLMLPGKHNLDSELRVQNISSLAIKVKAKPASNSTFVTCKYSGKFTFDSINRIKISGVNFIGCVNNTIIGVDQYVLEDCILRGEKRNGSALILNMISNARIVKCSFSLNSGSKADTYHVQSQGGGAIIIKNSGNVFMGDTAFTNNIVTGNLNGTTGGAMYVSNSTVALNGSTFINNSVNGDEVFGGALFAIGSTLKICGSVFINNSAIGKDVGFGGALYFDSSTIFISNTNFSFNNATSNATRGGVLSMFNYCTLLVENSTFSNNSVNGHKERIGGVLHTQYGNITVNRSTFIFNSVSRKKFPNKSGGIVTTEVSNFTLKCGLFTYNTGGTLSIRGFSFFISEGFLTILHNTGRAGVVYIIESRATFSGNTTISNNYGSVFAENKADVTFTGFTQITRNKPSNDLTQIEAAEGGAITSFQSIIRFVGILTNISFNSASYGGAILATESTLYLLHGNFTIVHNFARLSGGGIYAYHSELNFYAYLNHLIIANNTAKFRGGGMHIIGSVTKIEDSKNIYFVNNRAHKGGAISFMLNSKLYVNKGFFVHAPRCGDPTYECTRLTFLNNSANFGGAFYISDDTNVCDLVPAEASSITSECFFQVLAMHYVYGDDLKILTTFFYNNTATVLGDIMYGGLLDRCTVSPHADFFRAYKYMNLTPSNVTLKSYFLNITNLQPQDFASRKKISSDALRICFCKQNKPDCSYKPQTKHVRKGETFKVSLVAVDQVDNVMLNGTIIHGYLPSHASLGVGEATQTTNADGTCTNLNYTILSSLNSTSGLDELQFQLSLYPEGPCMRKGISVAKLPIIIRPCPIGFVDANLKQCECDPYLYPEYVSNCSVNKESLLRRENAWFSFTNNTKHAESDHVYVVHSQCPFDYCHPPSIKVRVNLNIPGGSDVLCAFNRSGKLCGSCQKGLSLSLGGSKCVSCSNGWIALIAVFALAGIILVVFILICNFTVATGTINGLIFYANIIAANRPIFLSFKTPNVLSVFVAWLNLDLGFETCFFDGLNGYVKVWLQLAFPVYVLFLVTIVIVCAEKYKLFAQQISERNPVATLATLILLSYTKFIRMIIAALSLAIIKYSNGFHETVWLYDANIPYLKGAHIPLFTTALLIIVIGSLYTFLLFSWQWLYICPCRWISTKTKLNIKAFMDAYHAPYNSRRRYWVGLLLFIRVILYLISALNVLNDPGIILVSIIICMFICILLLNNPVGIVYKNWYLNILESAYIMNIAIFAAVSMYIRESEGNQDAVAYASTSIAFATFVGTVIYHTHEFVYKREIKNRRKKPDNTNDYTKNGDFSETSESPPTPVKETVLERSPDNTDQWHVVIEDSSQNKTMVQKYQFDSDIRSKVEKPSTKQTLDSHARSLLEISVLKSL